MAVSSEKIDSIKNTVGQSTNPIQDIDQNVTSAIKDPFGFVINKTVLKINQLISNIEKKIDQLTKDVLNSTNNKGRVSLQGNTLVITVSQEESAEAQELKKRTEDKIESIRKTIVTLDTTLKTLDTISTAITTLNTVLTIQENLLSLNPTTGPIFQVLKKGIKIVFLKEMIKEYSKILKTQIKQSSKSVSDLSKKFKNITVSVKIREEENKGNYINTNIAESLLSQDLLNSDTDQENIENTSTDYISNYNKEYILKVEKYQDRQLIGRAYEKIFGMIEEQTAPSFFAKPEELIEELKTILNIKK